MNVAVSVIFVDHVLDSLHDTDKKLFILRTSYIDNFVYLRQLDVIIISLLRQRFNLFQSLRNFYYYCKLKYNIIHNN